MANTLDLDVMASSEAIWSGLHCLQAKTTTASTRQGLKNMDMLSTNLLGLGGIPVTFGSVHSTIPET